MNKFIMSYAKYLKFCDNLAIFIQKHLYNIHIKLSLYKSFNCYY